MSTGRPAELTSLGAGALAGSIALAMRVSRPWMAVVTAGVGCVAGAVSYCVDHGGVLGALKSLLFGRPNPAR